MVSPSLQRVRALAPLVASTAVVVTLITCVIIAKARDVYTGGLNWPYFSDMGRDAPGYYIFCIGLTVCALALFATWYFNYQFQRTILRKPMEIGQLSKSVLVFVKIHTLFGMISVFGLPVLSFFSTSSYSSLHNSAAYWFFFLETYAVCSNTVISHKIYKRERTARETTVFMGDNPAAVNGELDDKARRYENVRRTFLIQAAAFVLFLIAFLLYLPIGLAVVKSAPRLTIQGCLDRKLGNKYCTDTMRLDTERTKLWNYEDDFSANQMRSAAQLGCILTLVGYSISFLSHDYASVVDAEDLETGPNATTTTAAHSGPNYRTDNMPMLTELED